MAERLRRQKKERQFPRLFDLLKVEKEEKWVLYPDDIPTDRVVLEEEIEGENLQVEQIQEVHPFAKYTKEELDELCAPDPNERDWARKRWG